MREHKHKLNFNEIRTTDILGLEELSLLPVEDAISFERIFSLYENSILKDYAPEIRKKLNSVKIICEKLHNDQRMEDMFFNGITAYL